MVKEGGVDVAYKLENNPSFFLITDEDVKEYSRAL